MSRIVISSKLRVGHIRLRNVELGNELRMKLRMKTLGYKCVLCCTSILLLHICSCALVLFM